MAAQYDIDLWARATINAGEPAVEFPRLRLSSTPERAYGLMSTIDTTTTSCTLSPDIPASKAIQKLWFRLKLASGVTSTAKVNVGFIPAGSEATQVNLKFEIADGQTKYLALDGLYDEAEADADIVRKVTFTHLSGGAVNVTAAADVDT